MSSRQRDIGGIQGHQRDSVPPTKGQNYLLAIAINEYTHHPKLYNCVKDAKDIVQQLVYKYDFESQHVFEVYNEAASIDNIYKHLLDLSRVVTDKDKVMIFFAGHGYYDKDSKTGHLIPVNAEEKKVWDYLSNSNFLDWVRVIKSKHTFVVLDSCFSGSMFSTRGSAVSFAENVSNFKSRWGLAAGRIETVEDGYHGENSPFAKAILSYLKDNNSTKFAVSDLIQHVKRVTANNSAQTPIAGPIRNLGDEGGEFVFELKTDEATEWKKTLDKNTAAAYSNFISNYPNSDFIDQAKEKLLPLKEAKMWRDIQQMPHKELDDVVEKQQMIAEYKFHYPHGKFGIKANELLVHLNKTEELLTKKRSHQNYASDQLAATNQPSQSSDETRSKAKSKTNYNKEITKTAASTSKTSWWNIRKVVAAILIPVFAVSSFFLFSFMGKEKVDLELEAFNRLEGSNYVFEYEDFINEFPKSKYLAEVKRDKSELEFWQKTVDKNEKSGYEYFLELYARSRFKSEAEAAIKALEIKLPQISKSDRPTSPAQNSSSIPVSNGNDKDEETPKLSPEEKAWNILKDANSIEDIPALRAFIKKYYHGKYVREANLLLAALVFWEKADKARTLTEYEDYLRYYPKGPNVKEARKRMNKLHDGEDEYWKNAKRHNSEKAYKDYIRVYSNSKYTNEAKKELKKLKNKGGKKDNFNPAIQQSENI